MKYNIIKFNTIDSTNKYLKEHYQELDEYTICHSKIQTAGKGRMVRKWESNEGCLSFSILLKPNKDNVNLISLVAGATICTYLNRYLKASIKWPNDIMCNDKKICGILLESISSNKIEALVVGIGVNINQTSFSEEIKDKATSLRIETNKEYDLDILLKDILDIFFDYYHKYLNDNYEFLDILRNNNYLKDRIGYINDKKYQILDIDELGRLKVIDENKEISYIYSGEVSLRDFYNSLH